MAALRTVPAVSFNNLLSKGEARSVCIEAIGLACSGIGFVTFVDHPIKPEVATNLYSAARLVFAHSDDQLARYGNMPGGATGFTRTGVEHAKGATEGDLKRFWHVIRENNIWPEEVPEFERASTELFAQLELLCPPVLGALEEFLGYSGGTLVDMVPNGPNLLRILQYPPLAGPPPEGALRAGPHEDINLITFLMAAVQESGDGTFANGSSGLEVKTLDDEWVAVNETPGSIVMNVGDMLQEYTEALISTTHRVANPIKFPSLARLAMPFFVHPRAEVVLNKRTGLTAGEYLHQRLVEIGLIPA